MVVYESFIAYAAFLTAQAKDAFHVLSVVFQFIVQVAADPKGELKAQLVQVDLIRRVVVVLIHIAGDVGVVPAHQVDQFNQTIQHHRENYG